MLSIREDFGLQGQERAARIDKIDAGQRILHGDFLSTQVLLDGDGDVGAPLDRRVIGDNYALLTGNHANAGNNARRGRVAIIHIPSS